MTQTKPSGTVPSLIISGHMCVGENYIFQCPLTECCIYHLCDVRQLSKHLHPPDTTPTLQQEQQQKQLWIRPVKVLPRPPCLQEERHQLQLYPPVAGDNSSLGLRDSKSCPGSITPTTMVSLCVRLTRVRVSLHPTRRARWAEAGFGFWGTKQWNAEVRPLTTSPVCLPSLQ